MYYRYIIYALALITIVSGYSCNNTKDVVNFSENSFKEVIQLKNGTPINIDNLLLNIPILLRFHPDSFLIIQDIETPTMVKIIDLKNKKVQETAPHGRGPGEVLVAYGIQVIDKDLFIFDGPLQKVLILSPGNERIFHVTDEYFVKERTNGFLPLTKNLSVCPSDLGRNERLTFLDNKGNIVSRVGDFPPLYNTEIKADNDIFSSFISASPDGEKIVLACNKTDIIEIYDTNKGLIKRLHGPLGIKLKATRMSMGSFSVSRVEPRYATYSMLMIANQKEFWVGFLNYKFQKGIQPEPSEYYPKQILCFDWNGNPKRKIESEHPVISMDADWKNKILYTFLWVDNNPQLMTFSIRNIR